MGAGAYVRLNCLSSSRRFICSVVGLPCGQLRGFSIRSLRAIRASISSGAKGVAGFDGGLAGHQVQEGVDQAKRGSAEGGLWARRLGVPWPPGHRRAHLMVFGVSARGSARSAVRLSARLTGRFRHGAARGDVGTRATCRASLAGAARAHTIHLMAVPRQRRSQASGGRKRAVVAEERPS